MDKNTIIICIIHLIVGGYFNLYGLLIKNMKYDIIYISLIYFTLLHWTFLNGECIITYLYKKYKNKNYKAGENLYKTEYGKKTIKHTGAIFTTISFNIVLERNNIPLIPRLLIIGLYHFYYYSLCDYKNHYNNKNFKKFNNIMQIFIIIWGIYFYTCNYHLLKI